MMAFSFRINSEGLVGGHEGIVAISDGQPPTNCKTNELFLHGLKKTYLESMSPCEIFLHRGRERLKIFPL